MPDPAARVEVALLVRQALQRLPAAQREAIVAVDMHGYSVAEAAAVLGVAEGTVKSRCARGRNRLAVLLSCLAEGPETTRAPGTGAHWDVCSVPQTP